MGLEGDNKLIIDDFVGGIEELIQVFVEQGHSGGSAPIVIKALTNTIEKTLRQQPLSALTGADEEWGEPVNMKGKDLYQNLRDSAVLKVGKDGDPYYLNAIVWRGEEEWEVFTGVVDGITSRQDLRLPTQPKTYYVGVFKVAYDPDKHPGMTPVEHGDQKFVYFVKDKVQLEKVKQTYWLGGRPKPELMDEEE